MTVYYVRMYPANKEIASNECGRKEMNIFVLYMLHKRSQFTCKLYFICLKKDFCFTTLKSMDETATYSNLIGIYDYMSRSREPCKGK